ncbi:hypothetical protein PENTCL1PPCAC_22125, partial [Pristionchus entomophagus]
EAGDWLILMDDLCKRLELLLSKLETTRLGFERHRSNFVKCRGKIPSEEKTFPILNLPPEIIDCIIEKMDFPTRIALRKSCLRLYNAEALAKMNLEELTLYRTGSDEFNFSVKDKHSDMRIQVLNKDGVNVRQWMDDDYASFKQMRQNCVANVHFESRAATLLGELRLTMREYLTRTSAIDKLTIDGFHCSDSSMVQLCQILRGDSIIESQSINTLNLYAPFSTTSDAGLYELLHSCPKLRCVRLAIHRRPLKEIVVEKNFLLLAVSRLDTLLVHSRKLQGREYLVDHTEIDDEFVLRLLSDKCYHLEILYCLPLLTARGIIAAIQRLILRNRPQAVFSAYFRSELCDVVWRLLGLTVGTDDVVTSKDPTIIIYPLGMGNCAVSIGPHLTVKIMRNIAPKMNMSLNYSKIVIITTQKQISST